MAYFDSLQKYFKELPLSFADAWTISIGDSKFSTISLTDFKYKYYIANINILHSKYKNTT